MAEEQIQPQAEPTPEVQPVGVETPQVVVAPEVTQTGAETPQRVEETPKPARTYSQKEWSKRESEKDKENAQLKQQLAQLNLQSEIFRMQQEEASARSKDQKELDEGVITDSDATQRQQVRMQQRQSQLAFAQQQQMASQMAEQTEQYGRILAAQDFGKEFELNEEQIGELLKDKDIKSPSDMKAKAATLALERLQIEFKKTKTVPPKFDQGQQGGIEQSGEKRLKGRYPSMFKK